MWENGGIPISYLNYPRAPASLVEGNDEQENMELQFPLLLRVEDSRRYI